MVHRNNITCNIIMTKTDLMFVEDLARVVYLTKEKLKEFKCVEKIHYVSSVSKSGIAKLKEELVKYSSFDLMEWRKKVKKNVVYYL